MKKTSRLGGVGKREKQREWCVEILWMLLDHFISLNFDRSPKVFIGALKFLIGPKESTTSNTFRLYPDSFYISSLWLGITFFLCFLVS